MVENGHIQLRVEERQVLTRVLNDAIRQRAAEFQRELESTVVAVGEPTAKGRNDSNGHQQTAKKLAN